MNYEDAFRHYREGTATDEEKAFVLDEIAKAKALSSLLDDEGLAVKPAPIKEAEVKDVKDAKHRMIMRRVLGGLIAVVVILLALGAILGGVFGSAAAYARDNAVWEKAEAITIAKDYARAHAEQNGFVVSHVFSDLPRDVDEDFNFETDLKSSFYSYKVDVTVWTNDGWEFEYEIEVNSHTGSPSLREFEQEMEGYHRW